MHTKEDIERMIAYAKDSGLKEGEEIGMEKGMLKGKLSVAKSMLEKGMDIQHISELTGLSPEAITKNI